MQDFQQIADAPRPPALSSDGNSALAAAAVIVARRGDWVARRKRFGQGFIEQPLVVNRRLDVLADLTLFSRGGWLSGFPRSVQRASLPPACQLTTRDLWLLGREFVPFAVKALTPHGSARHVLRTS